jgi:uncharacterized membrane protein YgcG
MTSQPISSDGIRRGRVALWVLGVIVLAASVTAFAESYNGLREWAEAHRVTGVWADIWPLQVDTFIAAGELALLLSALYVWPLRVRVLGWTVSLTGLAVSIVCNAGHVGVTASISDHLTASLPPVAAIAGLVIALSVMKQVSLQVSVRPGSVQAGSARSGSTPSDALRSGSTPSGATRSDTARSGRSRSSRSRSGGSHSGGSSRSGGSRSGSVWPDEGAVRPEVEGAAEAGPVMEPVLDQVAHPDPEVSLAALEAAAAPAESEDPLLRRYEELFADR